MSWDHLDVVEKVKYWYTQRVAQIQKQPMLVLKPVAILTRSVVEF